VLVLLCGTAACIDKETRHTLYLSPDGSLQWTVLEQNIGSDKHNVPDRDAEEREFMQAASFGNGGVAVALNLLGASDVRTQIIRAERPYTVITDARFAHVDALATRILEELALTGSAHLTRSGDRVTLSVQVLVPEEEEENSAATGDSVYALVDELERYRIVLTDGLFDAADGFELHGNVAVPIAPDPDVIVTQGRWDLSLTWRLPTDTR
jgi:hypothetical protein